MSKFRTIVMYFALICVTLVLLFGVNRMENRLDTAVAAHNLRFTGQIKNAPPLVTFTTVALGSFRGLVADLLWLRAGSLQQQGSYFEMVQLARWITDLQPTFSGATAYLAWNMAYNISVTCSSFEDRWRWVNEGIKLIRDQAIEYNPEDPILYKELAWIFQHKLGNIMDDANLYYKNRLAVLVTNVAGIRPDWTALAAAPKDREAFMTEYPENSRVWKAARAAGYKDYDALYAAFKTPEPSALPQGFLNRIADDEKLVAKLNAYFHAAYLRERLKLDPKLILEINREYGEMDWRVPESQAIYWATLGIKRTPGHRDLSCDRIITQSLYEAFRSGRILMIDDKSFETLTLVPNLKLVNSVYDRYRKVQEEYEPNNSMSTFRSARINFLKDAVATLYNYGSFSEAAKFYKKLQKEEPGAHRLPLEDFVMREWAEQVRDASVKRASEIVSGLILRSIFFLIYNDHDAALANERMARFIYNRYQRTMGDQPRTTLPPYSEMKKAMIENLRKTMNPTLVEILKQKIQEDQGNTAGPLKSTQEKNQKESGSYSEFKRNRGN